MKTLVARSLIGTLFLLACLAYLGAFPAYPPSSDAVMLGDATRDFGSTRDDYLRKAEVRFQSWEDRIDPWVGKARTDQSAMRVDARGDLNKAWTDVKVDWRELRAAPPESWERARAAFEESSERLESVWARFQTKS